MILIKIYFRINESIKEYGFFYTINDLFYRVKSLKYKLLFKHFGKHSVILGTIHLFNKGEIIIGNNTRIDTTYRKTHFGCFNGGKIIIGDNVYINIGNIYDAGNNRIIINDNCKIGPNTTILSIDNHGKDYGINKFENNVEIGNNTWIGANCIILPGVIIGKNSIIGAGSIVTKSLPDNSICAGNPCKFIKKIVNI